MQGHIVDIIYEVAMPIIVKKEVHENNDDDCETLSVQPAPLGLVKNIEIKMEKRGGHPETGNGADGR